MLKKVFKKTKIKFLSTKLIVIFLFLLVATPAFGNETIRLYRFNRHIRQAQEQKSSKDYQKASETFQKAKDTLTPTLFLKSLKRQELEKIDNEIEEIREIIDRQKEELEEIGDEIEGVKELVNEKVKGLTTESLPDSSDPSENNSESVNSFSVNQSEGEMIAGSGSAWLFPSGSPLVSFSVSFPAKGGTIA